MKARYVSISAILAIFSSIAVAGFVQPAVVLVDLDNKFAQGDMWTARTANNDVEYIGCGTRVTEDGVGGTFLFGFCQAGDADGNEIVCFTQNQDLLDAMKSTSDFSFITFSWVDDGLDGFECVRIGFSTQSFYLPNFKIQKGMGGGDDDDDDDD
jgi:hypothetical protein